MTTIYHGWTKPLSYRERTANEYYTARAIFEDCKTDLERAYWFERVVAAWNEFREFATDTEYTQHVFLLLDFAITDPAHRRYADPMQDYETPMQTRASLGD